VTLLIRRRALVYHVARQDAELWRYLERIGATHLVFVRHDGAIGASGHAGE